MEVAFAVNTMTFLVSAGVLVGLRSGRMRTAVDVRGWSGALAGFDAVPADPLLGRLAGVQVLASMSAGATSGLLGRPIPRAGPQPMG